MSRKWNVMIAVFAVIPAVFVMFQNAAPLVSQSDINDFLVQKVCINANGVVLRVDPYTCAAPNSLRKLMVGETLPYRKHDYVTTGNPNGYQFSDSIALPADVNGATQYLSTMRFADGITAEALANINPPDVNPDGYNFILNKGNYVSFIGTKDSTGVQPFYNNSCGREDSWVLFPPNIQEGSVYSATPMLTILSPTGVCNPSTTLFVPSYSPSQMFANFTFTSGKTMRTIIAKHYNGSSVADAAAHPLRAFEVDYFTDIYGLSRWENWRRVADFCGANLNDSDGVGGNDDPRWSYLCSNSAPLVWTGCNGLTTDGTWVRSDCRDWTYVDVTDKYAKNINYSPYSVKVDAPTFFDTNLLKNTDFRINYGSTGFDWLMYNPGSFTYLNTERDSRSGRRRFSFQRGPTNVDYAIYQRISNLSAIPKVAGSNRLQFGVQASMKPGSANGTALLALFQLGGPKGTVATQFTINLDQDVDAQFFKTVDFAPGTTELIVAIYPSHTGKVYQLTNAWLNFVPNQSGVNILANSDFTVAPAAAGFSWQRYTTQSTLSQVFDTASGRARLNLSRPVSNVGPNGAPVDYAFFQTVSLAGKINSRTKRIQFGLQASVASPAVSGSGIVGVFQITPSGTVQKLININLDNDTGKQLAFETDVAAGATHLIWAFYPSQGNINYQLTNAWAALPE